VCSRWSADVFVFMNPLGSLLFRQFSSRRFTVVTSSEAAGCPQWDH
jgi:hypothetical protein